MKILEVLERVQALYPHPYKIAETVEFLNELGSIITTNYKEEFKTVEIADGEQLPEGVGREDIIRVIKDGKVLERDDFSIDDTFLYPYSQRRVINTAHKDGGKIKITYRVPYYPIRYVSFIDTVALTDKGFSLAKAHDIREGDILKSGNETFNVTGVEATDEGFFVYGNGNFSEGEKEIERVIDDLTVVSAPYDRLYIEFLISKVARFQKDYETENRALTNYNTLLDDFSKYLVRNGKGEKTTKFFNFW